MHEELGGSTARTADPKGYPTSCNATPGSLGAAVGEAQLRLPGVPPLPGKAREALAGGQPAPSPGQLGVLHLLLPPAHPRRQRWVPAVSGVGAAPEHPHRRRRHRCVLVRSERDRHQPVAQHSDKH